MNTYEGMFLFDSSAATEWSSVEAEVRRLMERAGAEIIVCKKWDERRLAYEIKGRKRGCYVLTYFKAPSGSIGGLERDVQLSESILRCLILRADEISETTMHSAVPADSERPADESFERPREVNAGEPGREAGGDIDDVEAVPSADVLAEEES